jgi:drug/metabolite transporter (DMT)-like permease
MLASAVAWGVTTQFASRTTTSLGLLQSTALQLGWGGFLLMIAARIRGENVAQSLVDLSPVTLAAWSFLVVVAGVMAYAAYAWLLANTTARLASTHAFVNPVIALGLSWLLLGEQIGPTASAAAALVTAAVVLLGTAPTPERA